MITVFFDVAAFLFRRGLQSLERFDPNSDMLRMFRTFGQQGDSKTVLIPKHRPIFVQGLEFKAQSLILPNVTRQIAGLDGDMINCPFKSSLNFFLHICSPICPVFRPFSAEIQRITLVATASIGILTAPLEQTKSTR